MLPIWLKTIAKILSTVVAQDIVVELLVEIARPYVEKTENKIDDNVIKYLERRSSCDGKG